MSLRFRYLIFIGLFFLSVFISLGIYFFSSSPLFIIGDDIKGPKRMVWISGGEFLMGSNSRLAKSNEKPAHKVYLHGFWIDQTDVTNAQFSAFVTATGYVTTAERKPDWSTIKIQLAPQTPKPSEDKLVPGAMVFVGTKEAVSLAPVWPFFIAKFICYLILP